jgi:hypothetical protein
MNTLQGPGCETKWEMEGDLRYLRTLREGIVEWQRRVVRLTVTNWVHFRGVYKKAIDTEFLFRRFEIDKNSIKSSIKKRL